MATDLKDWLAGAYSVPLELTIPKDTPLGIYPVRWVITDATGVVLTQFVTNPILEVLAAPPSAPSPTGVTISSLTVEPQKVKPGDKVTATAQATVNTGFKGVMSFALFGITVSAPEKDWLAGNYPVSLEVTTPQNTPPGTYKGVWAVIDTQANKLLASKDAQVEVVAEAGAVVPSPTAGWLTPVASVLGLALVGQMVMRLPKLLEKVGKK